MSLRNQPANQVNSVAGRTGDITLTSSDVGLGNVTNTSDASKPVSTATQMALNAKADAASLSAVATSGNYTDLANKPTIPTTAAQVGAVATANLDSAVASNITTSGTSTATALSNNYASASAVTAKYTKPSSGIPLSDLASNIQTQIATSPNYMRVAKSATTSSASSTTATNDPDLMVGVAANSQYAFELLLGYQADQTAGMKMQMVSPSGCTIFGIGFGVASVNTTSSASGAAMTVHYVNFTNGTFGVAGGAGVDNNLGYRLSGTLTTGSTAGSFGLAWAQNVSSATATKIYINSELSVTKIG